jgi:hypothetical protein
MINCLIAGVGAPRVGCSSGRAKLHNNTPECRSYHSTTPPHAHGGLASAWAKEINPHKTVDAWLARSRMVCPCEKGGTRIGQTAARAGERKVLAPEVSLCLGPPQSRMAC